MKIQGFLVETQCWLLSLYYRLANLRVWQLSGTRLCIFSFRCWVSCLGSWSTNLEKVSPV